jgi:outer membrane receptor protein involved in Fe transport
LFTTGLFIKKLTDIDYIRTTRVVSGAFNGFQLTEPVNGSDTKIYGIEVDLQTNFRFLPVPFDGLVFNANYTYTYSETYFPFFEIGPRSPDPPYAPTIIITFRKGTMPGQADHLANVSVGYEKWGFSGRLSVTYQGKSLQTIGTRSELDGYTDAYIRWDAAFSQKIGGGISLFLNLNNITNQPEQAYLGFAVFPTREQYFGWTGDLGVRFSL